MDLFSKTDCVVCGKATSTRCSGCRQLAFCSASHQKLLWSTHKHLCGKKEYCQPPITEPEVAWAMTHAPPYSQYEPLYNAVARLRKEKPALKDKSDLDVVQSDPTRLIALTRAICDLTRYPSGGGSSALGLRAFSLTGSFEWQICQLSPTGKIIPPFDLLVVNVLYFNNLVAVFQYAAATGQLDTLDLTEDDLWAFMARAEKMTKLVGGPSSVRAAQLWQMMAPGLKMTAKEVIRQAKEIRAARLASGAQQ